MIKSIRLKNWRSHGESEIEFLPGTNVIMGIMGAGKSSVLDAISFALFGTFPALSSKKTGLDGCITNRPEQRQNAEVELFFRAKGGDYSVKRGIALGKGTVQSELRKGGEMVEGPQTKRVTEEVSKLLGMDYDLFSRAVYSEQNQMDHFLQIPSGQRKRKIDELLRIDRFEAARKCARAIARGFGSEAEALRGQLSASAVPDVERERKSLGEIKGRSEMISCGLAAAKKSLGEREAELKGLEARQKELEAVREGLGSIASKLEVYGISEREIEAELSSAGGNFQERLEKTLSRVSEISAGLERPRPASEERPGAEQRLAILKKEAGELEKKLGERKGLEEKRGDVGLAREALERARREKEELSLRKRELSMAIQQAKKRLGSLEGASGRCPVCESDLGEEKRGELEAEARKTEAEACEELAGIEKKLGSLGLEGLEKRLSGLEGIEEEIKRLDVGERLSGLRGEMAEAEKRADELRSKAEEEVLGAKRLHKEKEGLMVEAERLRKLSEGGARLERIRNERKSLLEKSAVLEEKKSSLRFDESRLGNARDEARRLAASVAEKEAELRSCAELVKERERLIAEMEVRKKGLEAMAARAKGLSEGMESMETFTKAVEETQVQLREQFVESVNMGLSDVWARLYPYSDYPGLRLGVEGGDYTLQVRTTGGEWVGVEGFASGGERSTAAMALRIAFSMVLVPHLSWLVLDEPTHNLDSTAVSRLSEAMREHLPGMVEQIFVITHDEEMESAATGNLYRMERDKSSDSLTTPVLVSSGKG